MLSLIKKDLLLSKKMLPMLAVYAFIAIVIFSESLGSGTGAFAAALAAVGYMLMDRAAYYDDVNKAERMILSLPIHRYQVILAKYLAVLVYYVIGALSYGLVAAIINLLNIPWHAAAVNLKVMATAATGLFCMMSLSYPLIFKFGYIKTRIIRMFLFMGAFFLPPYFAGLRINMSDGLLAAYVLGFISILTGVSIIISLKVYQNKEL